MHYKSNPAIPFEVLEFRVLKGHIEPEARKLAFEGILIAYRLREHYRDGESLRKDFDAIAQAPQVCIDAVLETLLLLGLDKLVASYRNRVQRRYYENLSEK